MGCRCVLLDSSFPFPEVATWRWRNVSRFSKGTVRGCRSVWSVCLEKEATRSRMIHSTWVIGGAEHRGENWTTLVWNNLDALLPRFVHLFFEINRSNYPIVVSKVFLIQLLLTRTWSLGLIIKICRILVYGCRFHLRNSRKLIFTIGYWIKSLEKKKYRVEARHNKTLIKMKRKERRFDKEWSTRIRNNGR